MNAVGDLDGDGVKDIAVTSANVPHSTAGLSDVCTFLSGATGLYIGQIVGLNMGSFDPSFGGVHGLDDIDGDGIPDILLQWSNSQFRVFSGAPSHALIYEVPGATGSCRVQEDLGDLDGDGIRDFGVSYASLAQAPNVRIHSAATGQILYTIPSCIYFTASGDVDGDGIDDLATGCPAQLIGGLFYPVVTMRSGVNGALLWTTVGAFPLNLGGQLGLYMESGGDVNGDGYEDIFTVDNGPSPLSARVISGRTGAFLIDIDLDDVRSPDGCDPGGFENTRILGDLDGDGYAEFATSAPGYTACNTLPLLERGLVYIFRGGPAGETERFCDAPPNSTGNPGRLRPMGAPEVGSPHLRWQLYDAPPLQFTQMAFGLALGAGSPPITIGSGQLCFGAQGAQRVGLPVQTAVDGTVLFNADWQNPVIAAHWAAGTTWVLQAIFRDHLDPARANTSNALLTSFY